MFLDVLCTNTRRHIISYLEPQHFVTIKSLRKMKTEETQDVSACLCHFTIHDVSSNYRFRKFAIPFYITKLRMNCNNILIGQDKLLLPHLKTLEFFAEYRFVPCVYDWKRFFDQYIMPNLEEIAWHRVDIPIQEISQIFHAHNINSKLRKLTITSSYPLHTTFYSNDSYSYPKTRDLVELYRSCQNIEEMRLDYEDKYMDALYLQMFVSENDFSRLRTLHLMNRSNLLIHHICKKHYILPLLETLEITWLFETDTFPYQIPLSNDFGLDIYKPRLQQLTLSHISWGTLFQDFICSICLFSENCVNITTKDVRIVVIDCPNGYMETRKK